MGKSNRVNLKIFLLIYFFFKKKHEVSKFEGSACISQYFNFLSPMSFMDNQRREFFFTIFFHIFIFFTLSRN